MRETIKNIISEQLKISVPSVDTDLVEDGSMDSLALVQLLFLLEQEFCVTIPIDDLEIDDFRTVNKITNFVQKLKTPNPSIGG